LENGDNAHLNEVERRQRELQSKQQQLLREQRSADQEKLLACITGLITLQSMHQRLHPHLICQAATMKDDIQKQVLSRSPSILQTVMEVFRAQPKTFGTRYGMDCHLSEESCASQSALSKLLY